MATKSGKKRKTSSAKRIWERKNPRRKHKKLSSAQKTKAKRRAERAGRRYPNLVDNAAVVRRR